MTVSSDPSRRAQLFPLTRHTLLAAARGVDEERRRAHDALVAAYWKPIYKVLRWRWGADPSKAEDLTQGFFLTYLERGLFESYEPERARFRTYLRLCLDAFVANHRQAAGRLRRGGGATHVGLDFAGAEAEVARSVPSPELAADELLHREWVRHVFGLALERTRRRLEERGQGSAWRIFERYELEGTDHPRRPTYAQLADELGIPVTRVTNRLGAARRELRRAVLELLAEVTGNDQELHEEARALLGVMP